MDDDDEEERRFVVLFCDRVLALLLVLVLGK